MNDDEIRLYNLVYNRIFSVSTAEESDIVAIKTLVEYAPHIFPPQLTSALNHPPKELFEDTPGYKWKLLQAIIDADKSVPQSLRIRQRHLNTSEQYPDPTFTLDIDELQRVLSLCEAIRRSVLNSEIFDAPHKRRLLNRVAAIEREVHQPKGHLDVILGGVSDVGEALGKFGKDVKPLFDRMTEIMGIARGKSEEYEQLPPPEEVKRLPPPDDTKGGGV